MIAQDRQPYLKTRQDIDFQFFGSPTVLHATGDATDGRFCLMEHVTMPPGLASPYHRHHNEDEAFYVLDGHVRFACDGQWLDAGPGTWVYGPREIPHGFKVVGSRPARMLLMCAPAGFEQFVLELCAPVDAVPAPPDVAKLMAAAATFNIDILGPLPEERAVAIASPAGTATPFRRAVDETRNRLARARVRTAASHRPAVHGDADDHLLVARLAADLSSAARVDLSWCNARGVEQLRMTDIPVRGDAGSVMRQQSMTFAKASPSDTLIARLLAVDTEGAERLLGEYAFHHTRTIPGLPAWEPS